MLAAQHPLPRRQQLLQLRPLLSLMHLPRFSAPALLRGHGQAARSNGPVLLLAMFNGWTVTTKLLF